MPIAPSSSAVSWSWLAGILSTSVLGLLGVVYRSMSGRLDKLEETTLTKADCDICHADTKKQLSGGSDLFREILNRFDQVDESLASVNQALYIITNAEAQRFKQSGDLDDDIVSLRDQLKSSVLGLKGRQQ